MCTKVFSSPTTKSIEDIVSEFSENTHDNDNADDNNSIADFLYKAAENPMNLNEINREYLEQFPFLNETQIENLLEYRFDYGDFQSIYELSLIKNFDDETISNCLPFLIVYAKADLEKVSLKNIFKFAKHRITIRADYGFPQKKGYTNGAYLGKAWASYFKYAFTHKNASIAVSMDKDAGEPFDWKYNKGFDFYSGHISIKDIKHCKLMIIGDFKANFGQGLIYKSNSYHINSTDLAALCQRQDGFQPFFSVSEQGFLRGFATTLQFNKIQLSAFASHTQYNSENYHRTISSFIKKNTNNSYSLGFNALYRHKFFKIGSSFCYEFLSKKINVGLDYRAKIKRFYIAGEFAVNEKGGFATINHINFLMNEKLSFSALYRYYDLNYNSTYGCAYSESGLNDEQGLLIGFEIRPFRYWKISAFADVFAFKSFKYQIKQPSEGFKTFCQLIYTPNNNHYILLRYNCKQMSVNDNDDNLSHTQTVTNYIKHSFNLTNQAKLSDCFTFQTGARSNIYIKNSNIDYAWLLYMDFNYIFIKIPLQISLKYVYFDVPLYENRIYCYEKDVLFAYSSPAYSGQGFRNCVMLKYMPSPQWSIYIKSALIFYTDRETIGSANEEIIGNKKLDLRLLVSFKF